MEFIMSGSYLLILEERVNHLESNPGPLASQATTLTSRPWLLGLLTAYFYTLQKPSLDSHDLSLTCRKLVINEDGGSNLKWGKSWEK